ncbi:hypothetical protein G7054_g604 [Neopestalotiopsis clavispora]|nr:hypothetical protein G7054_g604 [Neopestalotiopsis clavispora]
MYLSISTLRRMTIWFAEQQQQQQKPEQYHPLDKFKSNTGKMCSELQDCRDKKARQSRDRRQRNLAIVGQSAAGTSDPDTR